MPPIEIIIIFINLQINQLPGIEHSQEEQLRQIENLRKQLSLKRQLLSKYRNMCTFSKPK